MSSAAVAKAVGIVTNGRFDLENEPFYLEYRQLTDREMFIKPDGTTLMRPGDNRVLGGVYGLVKLADTPQGMNATEFFELTCDEVLKRLGVIAAEMVKIATGAELFPTQSLQVHTKMGLRATPFGSDLLGRDEMGLERGFADAYTKRFGMADIYLMEPVHFLVRIWSSCTELVDDDEDAESLAGDFFRCLQGRRHLRREIMREIDRKSVV